MKAIRALLMLSIAAGVMSAAPSALAQYPLPGALADVNLGSLPPGSFLTVFGSGWLPGSAVDLTLLSAPVPLGLASVDNQGEFRTQVKIPIGTAPGQHSIRVTGTAANGQPDTVFVDVQVIGAGAAAGGGGGPGAAEPLPLTLPFTGVVIRSWMAAALLTFLVGVLALLVGRRRADAARYY